MKKFERNHAVNCQVCGREVFSYQRRPGKVGSFVMDLCQSCHSSTEAYKSFKEAIHILKEVMKQGQAAHVNDPQVESPNIIVQPVEQHIQKAVDLLKRYDPNFFKGIKAIEAAPEANYGHTESGPGKNPQVVHVNLQRILSESKGDKRNAIINLAMTIAHEVGHSKSYDPQKGFVGGEGPAMQNEQKLEQWIQSNEGRIQDLFK